MVYKLFENVITNQKTAENKLLRNSFEFLAPRKVVSWALKLKVSKPAEIKDFLGFGVF